MPPVLRQMQEKTQENIKGKKDLNDLITQKARTEERIRRAERNHMDDRLSLCLSNLRDISDSLGDLQNSLNVIWKKTKRTEEEIKEVLTMPSSLARPEKNPQQ